MITREIAVHGLGYVGLTAAVHYAKAGWNVLGYDPDAQVALGVNEGRPRAGEFLSYLDQDVSALVRSGNLHATNAFSRVSEHSNHVICVPSEKGGEPFDDIVERSLTDILDSAPDNALVMIESTLTPGFVDRYIRENALAAARIGNSLHLAVCPRRDWFADPEKNLGTLTRIVGGFNVEATQRAAAVIGTVSPDIRPTTYRTAEITKALENALLHIPMMFAYQLAWTMPDLDIAEALSLAGTHWRLFPLYLGFGSGGRCVPLGTKYLVKAAERYPLTLGIKALEFDSAFRSLCADLVIDWMHKQGTDRRVAVYGVAYRPDFRDAGLSPGLAIVKALYQEFGARVSVHDPMWTEGELQKLTGGVSTEAAIHKQDFILLATGHSSYDALPDQERLWRRGQIVLDGPGFWARKRLLFESYGVIYKQVGEPGWTTF